MQHIQLDAQRLLLRPFRESDAEVFSAYRSDLDIARYQGWDAPYSIERAQFFIHHMQRTQPGAPGEWYQLVIELKATGNMIGDCAFCVLADDTQQAEIGFTLARAYHRQGYGAEAVSRLLDYLLGDLGLHRVRANCDAENSGSARLMERIGMRREAHFIENQWFKGRWSSEYWYAILSREWPSAQRD